ncbi:Coiled-coil domain-containing protein 81 [Chytridiales sp. JEL 0842]|nr:Coiled-coil domain-containing protein 81 [Chytridiales sp. JEL 0842]
MNRLGIEDVIRVVCDKVPKSKRFSSLSEIELGDLWKESTNWIADQLSHRKSINFPGFGSFYIRKVNKAASVDSELYVPYFLPAKSWEKVPGIQVNRNTAIVGTSAAETLNFSAVASQSGFKRDDIECGLKDIVHAIFKSLKAGSDITLPVSVIGKLYFQQKDIRLRFNNTFIESLKENVPFSELSTRVAAEPNQNHSQTESTSKDSIAASPDSSAPASSFLPALQGSTAGSPTASRPSTSHADKSKSSEGDSSDSNSNGEKADLTDAENNNGSSGDAYANSMKVSKVGLFRSKKCTMHTHSHSGDRQWKDDKCPICRTKAQTFIENKQNLVLREKEQDKLLLTLSLALDREYVKKTKEVEQVKAKEAVQNAQYNHSKAIEQEAIRHTKKNLHMGNLFENREAPPDKTKQSKELARNLYDQMTIKEAKKAREKTLKAIEDQEFNERLQTEFKAAEMFTHLEKLRKRTEQQQALTSQMQAQLARKDTMTVTEPMTENPFARSESLMVLYQKEKAKQLYQEQLAIIKQKREYESRLAEMERQHSLERLALSRKELEKDLHSIKHAQFASRKALETVWATQKKEREVFC